MLGKLISISSVVSAVLLVAFWRLTTPATIGPLGILIVFILMYVLALGALTFLLFIVSRLIQRVFVVFSLSKHKNTLSLGRSYYFSSVLALAPVMFIGMLSVGAVSVYDVCLVFLFVIIACTYVSKRTV